jgi:hypothetical protein
MNHAAVEEIIQSVCRARGITIDQLLSDNKENKIASARRAIAMIFRDKYAYGQHHNSAFTWTDLADVLNCARSSLFSSSRRWAKLEGAQDGKEEERLRKNGCLLPKGQESIHEMAKRICKRSLGEMPKGRRKELGYWRNEGKVNHG